MKTFMVCDLDGRMTTPGPVGVGLFHYYWLIIGSFPPFYTCTMSHTHTHTHTHTYVRAAGQIVLCNRYCTIARGLRNGKVTAKSCVLRIKNIHIQLIFDTLITLKFKTISANPNNRHTFSLPSPHRCCCWRSTAPNHPPRRSEACIALCLPRARCLSWRKSAACHPTGRRYDECTPRSRCRTGNVGGGCRRCSRQFGPTMLARAILRWRVPVRIVVQPWTLRPVCERTAHHALCTHRIRRSRLRCATAARL